jgi:general secretion pathway protein A
MDQFEAEKDIAVIFNTNVSADELIRLIVQSFDLEPDSGSKTKSIEILYQYLIQKYAQNRAVLLIIDEAQNLSDDAIEEVRMLSNLQGNDQSLIQIMLVGQPELKERLKKPGHTAFSQRIAVNFYLSGLTETETESYITHRLKKAGGDPNIFTPKAVEKIYHASNGIPRTINLLCDAALVYGFGYEFEAIDEPIIEQVIKDKGGMGLTDETGEFKKSAFLFYDEKIQEEDTDRLKRLEDVVVLMKRQVDYVSAQMEKLEAKVEGFQENLDRTLKDLLVEERKQNDRLLIAYSKLRVKYHNLMKLWKMKKERQNEDDGEVIELEQDLRGKE